MKIAINLRGMSKGKLGFFNRDWKLSKNSIKESVIKSVPIPINFLDILN